ncbi:MAG: LysM peptidoglycan-binding domain-containing protein [Anaerolineae bacterium]|nr:LysM peptidoglycan-binding domain-containing protein [Anaerolineae bacterium]
MKMRRLIRTLLALILVTAAFGGVGYYVWNDSRNKTIENYDRNVTLAVETAIWSALYDATRTVEAPLRHYRLITLSENEPLLDVALRYNTTVEVLRMANNLLPTVDSGSGETIIVPEGVQELQPPRRFELYTGIAGDTFDSLAIRFNVRQDILEEDNPILAQRGIAPGDVVFIPILL